MKHATKIAQPLDTFGASPLLSASPALMMAGDAEPAIMTTLSPAGQAYIFAHGRATLIQKLCEECAASADRTRAARFDWRFMDPAPDAVSSPAPTPDDLALPGARPTLPDVIGREGQGAEQILYLYVNDSLAWFDGHFPDDPILPAVVQIGWAIHFGTHCGLNGGRFAGLSRLKFRAVIVPDTVLRLTLDTVDDVLQFVYESRGGLHSTGKIRFHRSDDQG